MSFEEKTNEIDGNIASDTTNYEKPNQKHTIKNVLKKIPGHTKITLVIGALSLLIHITASFSTAFSDFFTENIASHVRALTAALTGWFPFSLAETILLMLPVLLVIYFCLSFTHYIKKGNKISSLVFGVLSFLLSLYSFAVFTFLTGYSNSTLDKKLDMDRDPVSAQNLYDTASKVKAELDVLIDNTEYDSKNFSVMPYNIKQMSDNLLDSYKGCTKKYDFLHNINAQIKSVCLSEAMSYTHITGVYTFFTCEANIDVVFPDFTLPFTAAHEFAHQRGVARENEANFIAFLVCINSDDVYIKYSGYMNMLQYLLNALYSADRELYSEFYSSLASETKNELRAYSKFFDKYRDSTASKVSGAVNDTYLKLQGTEGTRSYGMVVDLAVAYYADK